MKPHPLLLLALAACGHSWPQLYPHDRRDAFPARLPVVEDDIDLVTLPVSKPGSKENGKGKGKGKRGLPVGEELDKSDVARKEARQFLNLDIDVPSLHSSGPGSKRGVKTRRDRMGRKEARQFLNEDTEIPSIHSTGPGSKRGVEARRDLDGRQTVGRKESRQFLNEDIEVPSLHSSGPGSKRAVEVGRRLGAEKEARQFLNEDLDIPSLHSSGPSSKRAAKVERGPGAQKEARQFLNEDLEIPSLHSSGPGSKRAVEVERELGAQKEARQFLNEDLEIPSLQSSGPGSKRDAEAERLAGRAVTRKKARQFHNDDIAEIPSIHSTGPSRSRRAAKMQLPVDEDLDMSAMTLPVSHRGGRVTARQDTARKEARQFHNDDIAEIPSIHSTGPSRSKRAKGKLPVDEDIDMSTMTLPVSTRTRDLNDADKREARQLPDGDVDSPGVLTLPVLHSTKPGLFKRAIEVELANRSDVAYYAQLNLGTPPQPVFVQLDTGSFELWVNPDCTSLSERDVTFCEAVGYYDTELSSTSSETAGNQTLRYGIGAANITYIRDSIGLPGSTSTLRDVQFGVATETEDQFAGILGLGHGQGATTNYKTFLDELVAQNLTPTRAFSLGLGSKNDQEGVITFGGVDTAKFAGGLAPVPIIPATNSPDEVPRYWVQLEGITLSPPGGAGGGDPYGGSRIPVFLDSGATLTLLPPDLAAAIAGDFGAEGEDENGFYPVDCGLVEMEGSLDFSFEGVTIQVPYREMIRELRNPPSCYLGIVPSEDFTLLGDTFLRSAYVVFDPDDAMTYLAQYESCGSMVRSLTTTDAIPDLYGVCGLENTVAPSSPSETAGESDGGRGGETEQAAGAGRVDVGCWVVGVGLLWWWLL